MILLEASDVQYWCTTLMAKASRSRHAVLSTDYSHFTRLFVAPASRVLQ